MIGRFMFQSSVFCASLSSSFWKICVSFRIAWLICLTLLLAPSCSFLRLCLLPFPPISLLVSSHWWDLNTHSQSLMFLWLGFFIGLLNEYQNHFCPDLTGFFIVVIPPCSESTLPEVTFLLLRCSGPSNSGFSPF